MHIVVIGTRGIPNILGGVETHCEELYPRLVSLGCDVTIIRRSCYITQDNQLTSYKGVKLKDVYAPKKKSFEAIIHSILAVIQAKKLKADILHVHAIGPALVVPFARLLGLKVVMTHHGPDYDRQKWGRLAKFSLKLGERWGVKYANSVISISNVITDIIEEEYYRENTSLIFNGVPAATKIADDRFISSLGLEKEKYILAMGRFVPEKGFDLLIDVFSELKDSGIKLVIAGDTDHITPYSEKLKSQAKKNGVILTGFITGEKLQEILTHARLFVLPSFHEGLPIALLEAMSYGLDVLVSDIPANIEVDLPNDFYFKTGDKESFKKKLKCKIEEPHLKRHYDMDAYDWEQISAQVLAVYKEMLYNND